VDDKEMKKMIEGIVEEAAERGITADEVVAVVKAKFEDLEGGE